MSIKQVAIIVVTWNKIRDVSFLIEDIKKLDLNEISINVFVVDNNSSDGTETHLNKYYSFVKVLQTGDNLGGSGGFSYGMDYVKELEYDYVWLLDNDVRLDTQSLLNLVDTLNYYPDIGLVGSQIRKLDQPNIIQDLGMFIYYKKAHVKGNFSDNTIESAINNLSHLNSQTGYIDVDFCSAASLLVRKEVIQQIGVFEDYFLHFDDTEWCLRAKKVGWSVVVNPSSIVWHSSPDFKQRPWISYYDERNLCYCWQKYFPDLLLKRIRVLLPKLIYYSITGRFFWVSTHLMGLDDFISGIKGRMPAPLPYKQLSIEEVLDNNLRVTVQASLYQDQFESQILDQINSLIDKERFTVFNKNKSLLYTSYMWLLSCFHKSFDLALVSCYQTEVWQFNLARKVYFFTGSGYVLVNTSIINLARAAITTFLRLLKIYWQIHKLTSKKSIMLDLNRIM
ncbi:glycosyltransferase family 2 protein [Cylindrospermopsis curvispora]|uniref:Glycosyltransferase family 2 protein n=1 Tax=Cylindrospermopsis curvispora GIHE-G1 TaxID=2666332 RepID=A0A7H0F011_9CYAN|nr:glycosyltransferase family 2 protein [Cylindrospermopsis curvispora]QNP29377.1 glycosyltransferase family 2 protein [Cylindrospermopsis curvispora GIHE-G1]